MEWRKSSEAANAAFAAALPDDPRVQRRKMFGEQCAFAGGHMFAGLHQDQVIVRLPEPARAQFLQEAGARVFEPMPGRPMREYVVAPPHVAQNPAALRGWLVQSLEHAAALPPKPEKPRKKR